MATIRYLKEMWSFGKQRHASYIKPLSEQPTSLAVDIYKVKVAVTTLR